MTIFVLYNNTGDKSLTYYKFQLYLHSILVRNSFAYYKRQTKNEIIKQVPVNQLLAFISNHFMCLNFVFTSLIQD